MIRIRCPTLPGRCSRLALELAGQVYRCATCQKPMQFACAQASHTRHTARQSWSSWREPLVLTMVRRVDQRSKGAADRGRRLRSETEPPESF